MLTVREWTDAQLRAIESDSKRIIVSAAAGSGKTAVLVERVLRRLKLGKATVDRLIIVTFTNLAADEMKERIFAGLAGAQSEAMAEQIALLPRANISTIHSFCVNLLRNYFYLLDIPPNFSVGDENTLADLKKAAIDEVFGKHYEANDSEFLKLVENFGGKKSDVELEKYVLRLHEFSRNSARPDLWLAGDHGSPLQAAQVLTQNAKEQIRSAIDMAKKARHYAKKFSFDRYESHIKEELQSLIALHELDSWDNFHAFLSEFSFKSMYGKPKDAELSETEKVTNLRDSYKDIVGGLQEIFARPFAENVADIEKMQAQKGRLRDLASEFSAVFMRIKKERRIFDFNDLEHFTIELLEKHAAEIAANFDEIYVDEFQDINETQDRIFELLAAHIPIFVVGDVKQSIYGFRSSRPQIFIDKINSGEGEVIHLAHNFRSQPRLIEGINGVFERIMCEEVGGVGYDTRHRLVAGRQDLGFGIQDSGECGASNCGAPGTAPPTNEGRIGALGDAALGVPTAQSPSQSASPIELHVVERNKDIEKTKQQYEAGFVAERILELVRSGEFNFGDIAVISRTGKGVISSFAEEFADFGIPFETSDVIGFFENEEISATLALLSIIDNRLQDIPLLACMRSFLFKFNDEQLAEIRLSTPDGAFYDAVLASEICAPFIELLEKWHEKSKQLPVCELLDCIWGDLGHADLTPAMQAIRHLAFEFEAAEFKGLYDFISYVNNAVENKKEYIIPNISAESENSVKIMTLHKSKGLEFPAVFLANCGTKFNLQDTRPPILWNFENGIAMDFVDARKMVRRKTITKQAVALSKKNDLISEEMRNLYVAMTRARERLFIFGIQGSRFGIQEKDGAQKVSFLRNNLSYLDWVRYGIGADVPIFEHYEGSDISCIVGGAVPGAPAEQSPAHDVTPLPTDSAPIKMSVSEVIAGRGAPWCTREFGGLKNEPLRPLHGHLPLTGEACAQKTSPVKGRWRSEGVTEGFAFTPAYRGTVVHFVMQALDLAKVASAGEIEAQIADMVRLGKISEDDARLIDVGKILGFFESGLGRRMLASDNIMREVKFFCDLEVPFHRGAPGTAPPTIDVVSACVGDAVSGVPAALSGRLPSSPATTPSSPLAMPPLQRGEFTTHIQGVIDAYFEDDGGLVIIDYKTGSKAGQSSQSKDQVALYSQALEKITGLKVRECVVWGGL